MSPIADAMTHIAGTPAWDALRNDMRMTPGGLAGRSQGPGG
jgi:hypothetical protein